MRTESHSASTILFRKKKITEFIEVNRRPLKPSEMFCAFAKVLISQIFNAHCYAALYCRLYRINNTLFFYYITRANCGNNYKLFSWRANVNFSHNSFFVNTSWLTEWWIKRLKAIYKTGAIASTTWSTIIAELWRDRQAQISARSVYARPR